jgi:hypothetical protein
VQFDHPVPSSKLVLYIVGILLFDYIILMIRVKIWIVEVKSML